MSVQLGLAMPQPGETITEGVVIRWIKKEGDMIKEKEPVVELETAKAVYEFESPLEGKLVKILVQPNETQQVGKALAIVECDDANAKKYMMFGVAVHLDQAGAGPVSSVRGEPVEPPTRPSTSSGRTATQAPTPQAATSGGTGALQFSPLIRSLAQEQGIPLAELEKIPATGPGGKLSKEDVQNYAKLRSSPLPPGGGPGRGGTTPAPAPTALGKRTEVTAIRKRIAENLHLSKTVIPHAGSAVDIDVTELVKFRESKKDGFQKKNSVSLSYGPFFMTAVLEALKKYPQANSFYIIDNQPHSGGEGGTHTALPGGGATRAPAIVGGKHLVESHDAVNIGFAVGAKQGLVVPVLKNAQARSFADLARGVNELVAKARESKLSPDDLTGGTVTVNNPGALGSTRGNQIIVYPQAIIVGFQKMVERPAVVNGKIEVRTIMECGCSFDHRILDGVEAVGFLEVVREVLENPAKYFNSI